ncbi:MAG: hypothetical protein LBR26_12605 [Prevotella sp.]|nr:hypothetical protein [Prevotella sp.]
MFGDYCPVRRYIQSSGCLFPAAGDRLSSGELRLVGYFGGYWSSSPRSSSTAYDIDLTSGAADPANSNTRAAVQSVRCVKEFIPVFPLPVIRNCPSIFNSRKNRARSFIRQ